MKAELSLCRILRSYLLYCYSQWTRGHMPQKRKSVAQSRVSTCPLRVSFFYGKIAGSFGET